MKPETQQWLDKLVPLLAHLKEGGKVLYDGDISKTFDIQTVRHGALIFGPENYTIVVEPLVIYVNVNERTGEIGMNHYPSSERAKYCLVASRLSLKEDREGVKQVRFVEDLNWKPDLDADHHLPEPPSKQASDYTKTI